MHKKLQFIPILLRGMSQILLQTNAWTGLLFLIGVAYSSMSIAGGACIGLIVATSTAYVLKYPERDVSTGIYGASGAMVGIAVFFFYEVTFLTLIAIILGAVLSVCIAKYMHNKKITYYTFPFVCVVWIIIGFFYWMNISSNTGQLQNTVSVDFLSSITTGISQILFQENAVTGLMILLGLLINSRISAVYAVMGSFFGVLLAVAFSFPMSLINIGLFGYNGVLCAIACVESKMYSLRYTLVSIILSAAIMYGMINENLIALSAPSIFATWITIYLKNRKIL